MSDPYEPNLFIAFSLGVGALFLWAQRRNAKAEATLESIWGALANENGWHMVSPMAIEALVDEVLITISAGEWHDGGPGTRVEGRLQDASVAARVHPNLEALRTLIRGLEITCTDGVLRLEWDRVERDAGLLVGAIVAVAEACKWEPPRALYR